MAATKDTKGEAAKTEGAKTEPVAAATAAPKKRGAKLKFFLFMILFGAAVPFIFPTLVFLTIGMLPTFVALLTDNDRNKACAASVGSMNAAGLTPLIIDLWTKGQSMQNMIDLLRQPTNWLVMLGAAGIGQLIYFAVPQIVASMALARDEARLKTLRRNIESLQDRWGADVGTTKPIGKMGLE